jgi:hypothetical protein
MHRAITWMAAVLAALLAIAQPATASEPIEIFDAHLHYNWEPKPHFQLADVIALFKRNRVTGIIATSRPNAGTHALVDAKADGLWVVPFIRPYRIRADIMSWMGDPAIYELVQEEYKRGYYRGIGEFHLSGKAAANQWVKRTVDFAVEKNLSLPLRRRGSRNPLQPQRQGARRVGPHRLLARAGARQRLARDLSAAVGRAVLS